MRRLVLTTSDSGAGHLKQIRRDAKVLAIDHRLVRDPAPLAATVGDFFAARSLLLESDPAQFGSWEPVGGGATARWFGELPRLWETFERVEFWSDPEPNSQLVLIQFLDWIGRRDLDISKLKLVRAENRLGERAANDPRSLNATPAQAQTGDLHGAHRAWTAFRQATPEAWADLLHADPCALSFLPSLVLRMLQELPSHDTALGASELYVLTLLAGGGVEAADIFRDFGRQDAPMLQYWEVGKLMDVLADAPHPAILGLEDGPFDTALHEDAARYHRYMHARLSLSPFGRALLERREDFIRRRQLDRWWGGTRLTNRNCWRWRDADRTLIGPA